MPTSSFRHAMASSSANSSGLFSVSMGDDMWREGAKRWCIRA